VRHPPVKAGGSQVVHVCFEFGFFAPSLSHACRTPWSVFQDGTNAALPDRYPPRLLGWWTSSRHPPDRRQPALAPAVEPGQPQVSQPAGRAPLVGLPPASFLAPRLRGRYERDVVPQSGPPRNRGSPARSPSCSSPSLGSRWRQTGDGPRAPLTDTGSTAY